MYKKSSDQINETYAAGSFWLEHARTPRMRLNKEASAISMALGGLAGAGAGYLTSDEKSSTKKRLARAGVGSILGAGAGAGISALRGRGSSDARSMSVTEALSKVDKSKLNSKEKKLVANLEKMFTKKASVHGAAIGAAALGTYGGVNTYLKHRKTKNQSMSEAEFSARNRQDYLDSRQRRGLKVSILDRKLNDMALREAKESQMNLSKTVAKGALAGAVTGAAAGYLATKGGG